MKEIKGFVIGIIITSLLLCGGIVFAKGQWKSIDVLENDITVIVDGKKLNESNFLYNDTTYRLEPWQKQLESRLIMMQQEILLI